LSALTGAVEHLIPKTLPSRAAGLVERCSAFGKKQAALLQPLVSSPRTSDIMQKPVRAWTKNTFTCQSLSSQTPPPGGQRIFGGKFRGEKMNSVTKKSFGLFADKPQSWSI
jgi:hypothetical protein